MFSFVLRAAKSRQSGFSTKHSPPQFTPLSFGRPSNFKWPLALGLSLRPASYAPSAFRKQLGSHADGLDELAIASIVALQIRIGEVLGHGEAIGTARTKIEFSSLNGNLMVTAADPPISYL
jgi:hypothetical protein